MPTICTVTGQISDIFAGALGELKVEFSSTKTNAYRADNDVISIKNLRTKTDTNGLLTVDLVPGQYVMRLITSSHRVDETNIVVPEDATANLANLIISPIPDDTDAAVQAVLDAQSARDQANAARDAAAISETNSATSASNAAISATNANTYKNSAEAAKVSSEAAQTASEAAKTGSEAARSVAESARDSAQAYDASANNARIAAEAAETAAQTSQTQAETAKTQAEAAKVLAEAAATNASNSESAAALNATNAGNSATTALAYLNQTEAYKDEAEGYKDSALLAQTAAETASNTATSAVAYLNLSGAEATLAVDASAVWKGLFPNIPLREQVTKSWFSELGPMPTTGLVLAGPNGATVYSLDTGSPVVWAPIQRGTGNPLWSSGDIIPTSIGWDGATLLIGQNGPTAVGGLSVFDFLKDEAYLTTSNDTTYYNLTSIADRNSGASLTIHNGLKRFMGLVDRSINAIATYTAPNAPLNEAGLPISVVAVGTDGGVSVFLENGSVTKSSFAGPIDDVHFSTDGDLLYSLASSVSVLVAKEETYQTDNFIGDTEYSSVSTPPLLVDNTPTSIAGNVFLNAQGVTRLYENPADPAKGMVQFQTPDYATPLKFGDCKLATLCEAEDTDLVAENRWAGPVTLGANWTDNLDGTYTSDGGTGSFLVADAAGGGAPFVAQIEIVSITSGSVTLPYDGNGANAVFKDTVGIHKADHPAGGGGNLFVYSNAFAGTVRLMRADTATPDRSVNGKGLIINTGLDVNPVFPGARTMAYSGFSAARYLWQPYNPALDFGTGDFSLSLWSKMPSSAGAGLLQITDFIGGDYGTKHFSIFALGSTDDFRVRASDGVNISNGTFSFVHDDSLWRNITVLRRSGTIFVHANSDLIGSVEASSLDMTFDASYSTIVGQYWFNGNFSGAASAELSLLTISAGAPTPEQIRLKYLAERPRFYGGAVDPTLPEAGLGAHLDPVTGLYHMVGATKQWAVDPDGLIVPSSVADKADAAHNRITVFDGEVITWEDAA